MKSGRPAAKSEETRRRILEAALGRFREHGFDPTTMREIAKAAGVAVGLAYYYFASKEALVMAFYYRAQEELAPRMEGALEAKGLEHRLRRVLEEKFDYFAPDRKFLGALFRHSADSQDPLSPFSEETRAIREADIACFERALDGTHVPADLAAHLPRLLWLYQMGLILFWIHDRSAEQERTRRLMDKSLPVVAGLVKLAGLPLTRPLRKRVIDLLEVVGG